MFVRFLSTSSSNRTVVIMACNRRPVPVPFRVVVLKVIRTYVKGSARSGFFEQVDSFALSFH